MITEYSPLALKKSLHQMYSVLQRYLSPHAVDRVWRCVIVTGITIGVVSLAMTIVCTVFTEASLIASDPQAIERHFLVAIPLWPIRPGGATSYVATPFSPSQVASEVSTSVSLPVSKTHLTPVEGTHQIVLLHTCWNYHASISACDGLGNCSYHFEISRELNLSDPNDHSRVKPALLSSHLPETFFKSVSDEDVYVLCPVSTFHTRKHYLDPICRQTPVPHRLTGGFEKQEVGWVRWDAVAGDEAHLVVDNFTCLPRDYVAIPEAYWATLWDDPAGRRWFAGATACAVIWPLSICLTLVWVCCCGFC
jgi:hypothetical protein